MRRRTKARRVAMWVTRKPKAREIQPSEAEVARLTRRTMHCADAISPGGGSGGQVTPPRRALRRPRQSKRSAWTVHMTVQVFRSFMVRSRSQDAQVVGLDALTLAPPPTAPRGSEEMGHDHGDSHANPATAAISDARHRLLGTTLGCRPHRHRRPRPGSGLGRDQHWPRPPEPAEPNLERAQVRLLLNLSIEHLRHGTKP